MTGGVAAQRPQLGAASTVRLAGTVAGMELAYLSTLTESTQTLQRVSSDVEWAELAEGGRFLRTDTLCHRMLGGAPPRSSDVPVSPYYRDTALGLNAGVQSYVGVPIAGLDGTTVGTLCAVDRAAVEVGDRAYEALVALAPLLAHEVNGDPAAGVWLSRSGDGWRVIGLPGGDAEAEDLTTAMVLADLLAGDLGGPGSRPPRGAVDADELARLRISVSQLEHALTARVVVEQAIGVLAERRRVTPRVAFETLRGTARGTGRRVHALAAEIVASAVAGSPPMTGSLARTIPITPTMVAQAHKTHAGTPGGLPPG